MKSKDKKKKDLKKDIRKVLINAKNKNSDNIEKKLILLLNDYLSKILSGEIKKIDDDFIKKLKSKIENETITSLNIDTFFRGINNIILKKKDKEKKQKKLEKYFSDYIITIPKRIQILHNNNDEIDINDVDTEDVYYDPHIDTEEFREWRKVVSTAPKFRIKRRTFEFEKISLQIELLKMRDWLNDNGKKLIALVDGRDASGKGSFIKTITENLHPDYFKINKFGIPTNYERNHWFERYKNSLPITEQIVFFDRSWYNRGVIEPVMGYCTQDEYKKFMKEVLPFEYDLIDNQNYYIVKLWFSITKETQSLRFELRKTSPVKYWKYSENDSKVANRWSIFTKFKEEMFLKTSTEKSPWVVVDSNDKRMAKLNAIKYILNQIPYPNKNNEVLNILPEIVYPLI